MIKKIGRLSEKEEKAICVETENVLALFDKSSNKGKKKFEELASCKNYFGRKIIAETAYQSTYKDKLFKLSQSLLNSKIYAKRATALLFFYNYYMDSRNHYFFLKTIIDYHKIKITSF